MEGTNDDARSLLGSTDWHATPLGAPEKWPGALRTTLAIMLGAGTPMGIYWGDDFTVLYNDAWRRLIGDKHPDAFGRPAREVFPEIWDEIGPMLRSVMAGGGTVRLEDRLLPVERHGSLEDAWFSFGMDAIPLEDGTLGGILNIAVETTERVLAQRAQAEAAEAARENERRKSFLLCLSDALRPLADPEEIQVEASRILGEHLGADRVAYAEDAGDADHVVLTRNYTNGVPGIVGRYRYRDFGPDLLPDLQAARNVVRPDVGTDPTLTATEKAAHARLQIGATLNVPLVKDGRLLAILAVHYRDPHDFSPEEIALVEEVADRTWAAVERARAEARERESRQKYKMLFEAIDEGFYQARAIFDADARCVDIAYDDENPAAMRMTGRSFRGRRLSELGPYETYWLEIFGHVARTGEGQRLERHAAPDDRWYDFYVFKPPRSGPEDVAVIFRDATQRKRSEEHQSMLTAELDHRVKNILSVVQAIARLSLGASEEAERLTGRITALAQSHALLASNRWEGARFNELVENAVAPYRGESGKRVAIRGPVLKIMPKPAQTLTLALHELVTNAAKYGALSRQEGRVTAEWELVEEGDELRLLFRWTERGGPPVAGPPTRKGFGSRLVERTLAYELEGKVKLDFAKEGLNALFDLPLSRLRVQGAPHGRAAERYSGPPAGNPSFLRGKKILVVEDEEFVAEETADALRAAGCSLIGPLPTLDQAMESIQTEDMDAAVLDVNLGGKLIWPVAMALRARGIPFVFATGYSHTLQAPHRLSDAPWIEKPLTPQRLVSVVASLFGPESPS